jgi:hypothetical protein
MHLSTVRQDPATAVRRQHDWVSVVRDRDESAHSASPAMGAMFAVMQMFYAREDAHFFWKESYDLCRNKLWKLRIHSASWRITCASSRRSLMERWELSRPSWSMMLQIGTQHMLRHGLLMRRGYRPFNREMRPTVLQSLERRLGLGLWFWHDI